MDFSSGAIYSLTTYPSCVRGRLASRSSPTRPPFWAGAIIFSDAQSEAEAAVWLSRRLGNSQVL